LDIRSRLEEVSRKGFSWHIESSRSLVNILAALYGHWVPAGEAKGVERVVILSKGHGSLALYATYEVLGLLPRGSIEVEFLVAGSRLQSHPESGRLPGVIVSSGSLGQGLSVANGIALAARIAKRSVEVAVVMGDGELDEGQVWEAVATSSSNRLDNVTMIIDRNGFQHSGPTETVKAKEPLSLRLRSFNWHVVEVADDPASIASTLESMERIRGAPKALIVNTWQGAS
jgi:transketolase